MRSFLYILSTVLIMLCGSCKRDVPSNLEQSGFPNEVGKILLGSCAVQGCHDVQSKDASGGLSLETWDQLFEGGSGGATVIPYSPDFSTLLYYVNTYDELGLSLTPTMPFQKTPLKREEVQLLKDWIVAGAPDRNGFVKFSENLDDGKYFITN